MNRTVNILALSGSLRRQSFNTALLRAAGAMTIDGVALEVATLHGIPLYDGDLEAASGLPDSVIALKTRIIAADALLIATPEYNNSIPGVLKNAIDWLSRPPADIGKVFGNRPVAVIGASPGGFGTILSQNAWLPVLRTLGTRQWAGGRLLVSRAQTLVNEQGDLADEKTLAQLREFIAGFAQFARDGGQRA